MSHRRVIVDGNNLLHAWPDARRAGRDFASARWALARMLDALAGEIGAEILVVFDGTHGGREEALSSGGVEVRFATAALSADFEIERAVRAAADPRALLVVTSDLGIQRAVAAVGAEPMSCDRFLDWARERAQALAADLRRPPPPHQRPRLGDFFPPGKRDEPHG